MKSGLKRTQVDGEKYRLPGEEVEIEKLIRRGMAIEGRIKAMESDLEAVKRRLTEIAETRRGNNTTVTLPGISGASVVTFRESYEAGDGVAEIGQDLGDLFDRFFARKVKFAATKDLKRFMTGEADYGFEDPGAVRELIGHHVTLKTIKPNVKFTAGE